jgi:hypothetical protein
MNYKATVKGIAASGGTRPDGHITACPVTAIKAGPVAHTLTGQVRPHRARQSSAPVGHRQGTLTITGSNVRLGTEMPVALSLF